MRPKIKSSRDVIIRTKDWAKAAKFYGSVLGLPVTNHGKTLKGFETGSFCLYVENGEDHGPVFDFRVHDVQATKRKLIAAGCVLVEEDESVPQCYLRDPFGIVFNLGQA
jgi:catechol 2,3-dioxygenase-like lactoylglutathione lyase family enzyme